MVWIVRWIGAVTVAVTASGCFVPGGGWTLRGGCDLRTHRKPAVFMEMVDTRWDEHNRVAQLNAMNALGGDVQVLPAGAATIRDTSPNGNGGSGAAPVPPPSSFSNEGPYREPSQAPAVNEQPPMSTPGPSARRLIPRVLRRAERESDEPPIIPATDNGDRFEDEPIAPMDETDVNERLELTSFQRRTPGRSNGTENRPTNAPRGKATGSGDQRALAPRGTWMFGR